MMPSPSKRMAMDLRHFGLLCLVLAGCQVMAQPPSAAVIRGSVTDTSGRPLAYATVSVTDSTGLRILAYALTGTDGGYRMAIATALPRSARIRVEHLQMERAEKLLPPADGSGDMLLPPIEMHLAHRTLEEIVVKAEPPSVFRKGDTLVYAAKAFADAETRKVEDLLRRMPGFQVSSDGRIHVNGREVDRILIDGDDLTERNYRLLSRSLQAGIVDKVEVIDHYHPDRILGQVEPSERVGINLRTDSRFRDRLSLDLAPGIGTAGRTRSDAQATYLKESIKAMTFLDMNRTAGKPGVGLQTAVSDDSSVDGEGSGEADLPVRTGRPAKPPMEEAYVRDNHDASAVQVLSTRLGDHARLRFSAAMGGSRWQALATEANDYLTPDAGSWTLQEDRSLREERRERSARLAVSHDRRRYNVGQWTAEVGRRTGFSTYRNLVAGAIRDSLTEHLADGMTTVSVKGTETYALPGRKAVSLRWAQDRSTLSQDFDIGSGRWQGLFGRSATEARLLQGLDVRRRSREADLTLHARGRHHDWQLAAEMRIADQRYVGRLDAATRDGAALWPIRAEEARAGQHRVGIGYVLEMHPRKRWTLGASLAAGGGGATASQPGVRQDTSALLYRAMLSLRRSYSPRDRVWLSLAGWRELPSPDEFLPERLDGDITVRSPASRTSLADRRSFQLAYVRQDLPRARSTVLSLGAGHDDGAYVSHITRSTTYTRITRVPSGLQWSGRAGLHAERFLDVALTRSVTDLGWMVADAEAWFNGIPGRNRVARWWADQKLVSAFDGWFNLEGGWRSDWMANTTEPATGVRARHALWQHQGYLKARIDASGRPFIALRYARRSLAPAAFIGMLDLFASWQARVGFRLTLHAHNLTGLDGLSIDNLSANQRNATRYGLVGRYLLLGISWTR